MPQKEPPKSYKIIAGPLYVNNEPVPTGETVELLEKDAKDLVAAGVLEDPTAPSEDPTSEVNDQSTVVSNKVSLNTAPEEQLVSLNHVGKSAAGKIIAGRPYTSIEEAQKASGIKSELWAEIEKELSL